jgi:hypothetical protein
MSLTYDRQPLPKSDMQQSRLVAWHFTSRAFDWTHQELCLTLQP